MTPPPASTTAPPAKHSNQQAIASSAPGNSSSPLVLVFIFFPSLHAERVAFCMQADPGPALSELFLFSCVF
jgi:hypothetical protein